MTGPGGIDPDALPIAEAPQRVSGMRVPEGWRLPGKPADLTPTAEDAWRQTGFLLADDLRLLETGLPLQARIAAAGYTPAARTMRMAAFASLWSRAFISTSDAVVLVRRGGYQSALPLLRQAIEHVAAQAQLGSELDDFRRWAHQAYARDHEARAEDVGLGHFFGGEAIATDDALRPIYRAASDFGRPNFGPTALFVATEATHARYPLVFADDAFHLGWAQLLLGWALRVEARQLHVALHLRELFPAAEALRGDAETHVRAVDAHLAQPNRCRLEEYADTSGRRRHLLADFRRRPADASRHLLL
ncbi:MAG: hypothetical protein FJ035_02795 [Chloroflexi bacterium]|nr:hypothetical protein [Chloroflexota bacterium]